MLRGVYDDYDTLDPRCFRIFKEENFKEVLNEISLKNMEDSPWFELEDDYAKEWKEDYPEATFELPIEFLTT